MNDTKEATHILCITHWFPSKTVSFQCLTLEYRNLIVVSKLIW
ncbi:hypothetical protein [Wolbachia endosymbiont of Aedes albopictus]|nr:hypothetical protein [Wolbachia endosymbiont of Aedes albopictus]UVW83461.1 hypothetical protein NHG98_03675 [Wolbachia endosymbiont of Aedes albopictus]